MVHFAPRAGRRLYTCSQSYWRYPFNTQYRRSTLPLDVLVAKSQDAKKAGEAVSAWDMFQAELEEKGWNGLAKSYERFRSHAGARLSHDNCNEDVRPNFLRSPLWKQINNKRTQIIIIRTLKDATDLLQYSMLIDPPSHQQNLLIHTPVNMVLRSEGDLSNNVVTLCQATRNWCNVDTFE